MPSKKAGETDARIHTARDDSDSGTPALGGPIWCPYPKTSPSSSCACGGSCWYEEKAEREAPARDESVDGVHSRKARQKA